jgi:hypothetical protein
VFLAALLGVTERPATNGAAPGAPARPGEGKLQVTCRCGQQLQARKQFAGTRVRCPCCSSFILLPGKSTFGTAPEQVVARPHGLVPVATPAAARPPERKPLLRTAAGYVGLVALLLLTLVFALSGFLWGPSASPPKDKEDQPTPKQTARP